MKDEIKKKWTEDFEHNGKFFLAGYDSNKINGKVKYSKGRIELILFEPPHDRLTYVTVRQNIAFRTELEFSKLDVMHGVTNDGIKITLVGCYLFSRNSPHYTKEPRSFFETSKYSVNQLFIGKHFNSQEEIQFNGISIEYLNFNEWLNKSSIEHDMDFSPESTDKISFKQIPSISGPLFDDLDFQIHYGVDKDVGASLLFEGNFKQRPVLIIHGKELRKFGDLLTLQLQLRNLIQIGLFYQLPHILLMEGYVDEDQFETVLIYYTNDVSQRISNPVDGHQMFFTLDKVQKYLPSLFSEWLKLYNKHKNIFSLYFDTIWHTSLPRETEFNSIVQALEGYHRTEIRGKRLFPKPYFRSLIRNMRTKCTHPDEKKLLKKFNNM